MNTEDTPRPPMTEIAIERSELTMARLMDAWMHLSCKSFRSVMAALDGYLNIPELENAATDHQRRATEHHIRAVREAHELHTEGCFFFGKEAEIE